MVYENQSTKSDLLPILLSVSAVAAIIFGGMIVTYNANNHDKAELSNLQQQVTQSQSSLSSVGQKAATTPEDSAQSQKPEPLAQTKTSRHRV